ncbi:hypothetical protein AB0L75_41845 [Streptomyces sp. NPDC052101]|uniref:hypothetical protein n=1 Tax=Streptomyces sp. NPDC052101 TaxID=3155763 RepID=UPI0034204A45
MSTSLDDIAVKRLILARHLVREGTKLCGRPRPFNVGALLNFQDAVELLLVVAYQHLDQTADKMPTAFDQLVGDVAKMLNDRDDSVLPGRAHMKHLNKMRVDLKHHGVTPAPEALEEARRQVTAFMDTTASLVFGIDLDTLDLVGQLPQAETASQIREADAIAETGDLLAAAIKLRKAFDEMVADYSDRKQTGWSTGPYSFGETVYPGTRTNIRPSRNPAPPEVYDALIAIDGKLQKISHTTKAMQQGMRVLATGIDYRAYARFSMLAPEPHADRPGLELTEDDFQFCREFVVESALHLANQDFDLNLPALAREYRAAQAPTQPQGTDSE